MELVTRIPSILTILNSKCPRAGLSLSTRGLPKTKGIPNRKRRLLGRIPDCSDEISLTETGHFKQGGWHVLRDQWQKSSPLSCSLSQCFCFPGEAACAVCRNTPFSFLSSSVRATEEQQEEPVAPKLHETNSTWWDRKKHSAIVVPSMVKHPELQIYSNKWR